MLFSHQAWFAPSSTLHPPYWSAFTLATSICSWACLHMQQQQQQQHRVQEATVRGDTQLVCTQPVRDEEEVEEASCATSLLQPRAVLHLRYCPTCPSDCMTSMTTNAINQPINPFSFNPRFSCTQGRGGDGVWTRQWWIAGPHIDKQPSYQPTTPLPKPPPAHTGEFRVADSTHVQVFLDCGKTVVWNGIQTHNIPAVCISMFGHSGLIAIPDHPRSAPQSWISSQTQASHFFHTNKYYMWIYFQYVYVYIPWCIQYVHERISNGIFLCTFV